MDKLFTTAVALFATLIVLQTQNPPRAGQPIVLEWADSLVGTGGPAEGVREFIGHVRFTQGNVTVLCNRALQSPATNTVDLFGNVVVTQDALTLTSNQARYDGNARVASAVGGLKIVDGRRTITARDGTYSTATRQASFQGDVTSADDTVLVWSNHATYNRNNRETSAWGNVVAWDTVSLSRTQCDSLLYRPDTMYFRLMGDAAIWDWETNRADTMLVVADTIIRHGGRFEQVLAYGEATVVGGTVAGRADTIVYSGAADTITLTADPVVWADSTEFLADTIGLYIPNRKLRSIVGYSDAILISLQDTTQPGRYDQIAGEVVVIDIEQDTIRNITAIHDARSITYRMEDGRGEGLANFTSDTIKAIFDKGALADVFWLGGIEGEHQPEHLVAGRESTFLLPTFEWRTDKPVYQQMPGPRSPKVPRIPVRVKPISGQNDDGKKKP